MKKLYFTIILAFLAISAQAQIDRSKMPEPGPAPKIARSTVWFDIHLLLRPGTSQIQEL